MPHPLRRPAGSGFTLIEILIVILVITILIAIAIPNWMHARDSARSKSCCQNLRQIDTAKEQWGMTAGVPLTAEPEPSDLVTEYMKGTEDTLPVCPSGGTYGINNLASPPSCTIGDNSTASDFDDHVVP